MRGNVASVLLLLLISAVLSLALNGLPSRTGAEGQPQRTQLSPSPSVRLATPLPVVTHNADWTSVIQTIDGVEMALVPPGCFQMGSNDGYDDEEPVHEICFEQPFWIDLYEVSNGQFARFDGRAANVSEWTSADRPRERVTWFEARDFCMKRGGRLPTEAEWEYAARGPSSLGYPWGNTFDSARLNYCDRNCPFEDWMDAYGDDTFPHSAPVGSYPTGASWVGALDLSGNVWEWTSSLYEPYPYSAGDGREAGSSSSASARRGARGGAWSSSPPELRGAYRDRGWPDEQYAVLGFRCAHTF